MENYEGIGNIEDAIIAVVDRQCVSRVQNGATSHVTAPRHHIPSPRRTKSENLARGSVRERRKDKEKLKDNFKRGKYCNSV